MIHLDWTCRSWYHYSRLQWVLLLSESGTPLLINHKQTASCCWSLSLITLGGAGDQLSINLFLIDFLPLFGCTLEHCFYSLCNVCFIDWGSWTSTNIRIIGFLASFFINYIQWWGIIWENLQAWSCKNWIGLICSNDSCCSCCFT